MSQASYCFFYRQNRWPGHQSETVFHELPQGQARVEGTTIQTNQRCKVYLKQNNKFCDNNANWMSFQWKRLKSSNQKIWVNRHACIIIIILYTTVGTCIWSCQYFCYYIVHVPSINFYMYLLISNWSNCIKWLNMPLLKLENACIWVFFSHLPKLCLLRKRDNVCRQISHHTCMLVPIVNSIATTCWLNSYCCLFACNSCMYNHVFFLVGVSKGCWRCWWESEYSITDLWSGESNIHVSGTYTWTTMSY